MLCSGWHGSCSRASACPPIFYSNSLRKKQPACLPGYLAACLPACLLRTAPRPHLRAVEKEVAKSLGAPGTRGSKLTERLLQAIDAWRRWAVALHWLLAAAKSAGLTGALDTERDYTAVLLGGWRYPKLSGHQRLEL